MKFVNGDLARVMSIKKVDASSPHSTIGRVGAVCNTHYDVPDFQVKIRFDEKHGEQKEWWFHASDLKHEAEVSA